MFLSPYVWPATLLARAELGDLATWIGAIANVATVVLALTASLVGFRVYQIESGRDQRAEEDRRERAEIERRGQAQLVSVWFDTSTPPKEIDTDARGRKIWPGIVLPVDGAGHLLNASNLPVHDAELHFVVVYPDEAHIRADPWADAPLRTSRGVASIGTVPPHRGIVSVPIRPYLTAEAEHSLLWHRIEVSVIFRDTAGRRWLRNAEGYLVETPAQPPPP
ncbi:hypothetical protein OOJ91_34155 [Micromonospora lupini]|uniref:hypothetical protein n=1 Tax=Micromonospora lupini TaxID=285679 RepID=UPI002259E8D7|nr:hypothetical protein [Micromonospora lupini]MCX5070893.1 hypothetical protein [Micromonospora lupini]